MGSYGTLGRLLATGVALEIGSIAIKKTRNIDKAIKQNTRKKDYPKVSLK